MNVSGPLEVIRAYARRWQRSTAKITREDPDAEPVFDEQTGEYTDPDPIEVYDGSCLVAPEGGDRVVEFGEGPTSLRTYRVTLDGIVDGIKVGDDVAISGSRDSSLDGVSLKVLDVPKSDHVTNRSITVEEVLP